MHDAVAVGEDGAALAPHRPLDRGDDRARIVLAGDGGGELPHEAVARGFPEQAAAGVELDRRRRRLLLRPERDGGERNRDRESSRRQHEQAGGPPRWRAARSFPVFPYLISNLALPVVWLPAMSVASQRNSVVVETTNDWPGSRGPVESQSADVLSGFDPSVV